jgi:hypothetical protein
VVQLEFFENEVSKAIHIPILQDSVAEGSEEFTVRLGTFPTFTAIVQIDDDAGTTHAGVYLRSGRIAFPAEEFSTDG